MTTYDSAVEIFLVLLKKESLPIRRPDVLAKNAVTYARTLNKEFLAQIESQENVK